MASPHLVCSVLTQRALRVRRRVEQGGAHSVGQASCDWRDLLLDIAGAFLETSISPSVEARTHSAGRKKRTLTLPAGAASRAPVSSSRVSSGATTKKKKCQPFTFCFLSFPRVAQRPWGHAYRVMRPVSRAALLCPRALLRFCFFFSFSPTAASQCAGFRNRGLAGLAAAASSSSFALSHRSTLM